MVDMAAEELSARDTKSALEAQLQAIEEGERKKKSFQ